MSEAVRSSQFSGVQMPSYRTNTTNFENALGGRGELGVGRNWTGKTIGAKGIHHNLQLDAIRTASLLRTLSSDCYQVSLLYHSLTLHYLISFIFKIFKLTNKLKINYFIK